MAGEPMYDEWKANRRAFKPACDLTARVMAAMEEESAQPVHSGRLAGRLDDRMNESLTVRWAASVPALLVGSLPFLLVAYAAHLLVF